MSDKPQLWYQIDQVVVRASNNMASQVARGVGTEPDDWSPTDEILELFANALWSDEAKAAAGKHLYDERSIELDQDGDDDWDILPWQDEWIEGAESALIGALVAVGVIAGPPTCRVCGCTDDHACEGGCWWVEPDLCSACAEENGGAS